jgi:chemotaxis protein methyltransferase CheR
MTEGITSKEFDLWRNFIYQHSGILLNEEKAYLIEHRLSAIMNQNKCKNFAELLNKVKQTRTNGPLCHSIIDAITTNETFWFRDAKLFNFLTAKLFRRYKQEIEAGLRNRVQIWSAACSTGQEPYSIAMTALDAYEEMGCVGQCADEVGILASDISNTSLESARRAVYDNVSVGRGLSPLHITKYFDQGNSGWALKNKVKRMVELIQFNLRDPMSLLGPFDAVFLRNVTIYFSEEFKKQLFSRLSSIMNPMGVLFLGTGESVGQYSNSFDVIEEEELIYYRLKPRWPA